MICDGSFRFPHWRGRVLLTLRNPPFPRCSTAPTTFEGFQAEAPGGPPATYRTPLRSRTTGPPTWAPTRRRSSGCVIAVISGYIVSIRVRTSGTGFREHLAHEHVSCRLDRGITGVLIVHGERSHSIHGKSTLRRLVAPVAGRVGGCYRRYATDKHGTGVEAAPGRTDP